MADLSDITVTIRVDTPTIDHDVTLAHDANGELRSTCSCGATWTHPPSRTDAQRAGIEIAHRNYHRPLTKPD